MLLGSGAIGDQINIPGLLVLTKLVFFNYCTKYHLWVVKNELILILQHFSLSCKKSCFFKYSNFWPPNVSLFLFSIMFYFERYFFSGQSSRGQGRYDIPWGADWAEESRAERTAQPNPGHHRDLHPMEETEVEGKGWKCQVSTCFITSIKRPWLSYSLN